MGKQMKEKNEKLKIMAIGLLGHKMNYKDARIGIMQSELDERRRIMDEFKKSDPEFLSRLSEEVEIGELNNISSIPSISPQK
jgi:hypothetical protein